MTPSNLLCKASAQLLITILGLSTFLKQSESYNMEKLTVRPNVKWRTHISHEQAIEEVLEFEQEKSGAFDTADIFLRHDDLVDLCSEIANDADFQADLHKDSYRILKIKPQMNGRKSELERCFGWRRQPCGGNPRPPFDQRCHYWSPFWKGAEICSKSVAHVLEQVGAVEEPARRKKRGAYIYDYSENVVLGGVDALMACVSNSMGLVYEGLSNGFTYDFLTIPLNVQLQSRCANFKLTPDGWMKHRVSDAACTLINKHRPQAARGLPTAVEDELRDTFKCETNGPIVASCTFLGAQVMDPDS